MARSEDAEIYGGQSRQTDENQKKKRDKENLYILEL